MSSKAEREPAARQTAPLNRTLGLRHLDFVRARTEVHLCAPNTEIVALASALDTIGKSSKAIARIQFVKDVLSLKCKRCVGTLNP